MHTQLNQIFMRVTRSTYQYIYPNQAYKYKDLLELYGTP